MARCDGQAGPRTAIGDLDLNCSASPAENETLAAIAKSYSVHSDSCQVPLAQPHAEAHHFAVLCRSG